MASSDWPDYTHGVVLSDGSVTDCPDWQEQVVGPGGVPISGGGGLSVIGQASYGQSSAISGNGSATVVAMTCTNAAAGYALLSVGLFFVYTGTLNGNGVAALLSGDFATTGSNIGFGPDLDDTPGVAVTNREVSLTFSGPVYLTQAAAVITLEAIWDAISTGYYAGMPGIGGVVMMATT